jgi:metal-responsive CopG/Arc/MetJ family transcriptional regulator
MFLLEDNRGMKVKTSVTLSEELVSRLDQRARRLKKNRSELIEAAVAAMIEQLDRREISDRDIEIIRQHADELNAEAEDVLSYQITP